MLKRAGHVYLVGAGPGPADLLTMRARRLLRRAEVLAYDDLVHPSLLELAPFDCELIAIGYRAGEQARRPPPLHPDVLDRARAGKRVVRLKSGDPLIFGRGGEEAEALQEAAISFSFVPGITAALAAAASCHLPLTWRGRSSELRISTQGAHFPSQPSACTYALYMPRHAVSAFAAQLIGEGWATDTPAAFVIAAAHRQQQCIRSSLADLAAEVAAHPSDLPGIVLVGESLRNTLSFPAKPRSLQGCRILLARAHADASQLQGLLTQKGADAWSAPWIQARPRIDPHFDWNERFRDPGFILIPSASAFRAFRIGMEASSFDIRRLYNQELITIGGARAELAQLCLRPLAHIAQRRRLLEEWPHHLLTTRKGLILSAGEEGWELQEKLAPEVHGCEVLACAEFEIQYPRLPVPRPDFVVAPHRKALRCLMADPTYRDILRQVPLIAFGASVAALAEEWGCTSIIQVAVNGIEELLPLLTSLWAIRQQGDQTYGKAHGREGSSHSLHGAW